MFQIVCIDQNTRRPSTIAAGFCSETEARSSAEEWIDRWFVDATYDYSKDCWWLVHDGCAYRVVIQKASNFSSAAA